MLNPATLPVVFCDAIGELWQIRDGGAVTRIADEDDLRSVERLAAPEFHHDFPGPVGPFVTRIRLHACRECGGEGRVGTGEWENPEPDYDKHGFQGWSHLEPYEITKRCEICDGGQLGYTWAETVRLSEVLAKAAA